VTFEPKTIGVEGVAYNYYTMTIPYDPRSSNYNLTLIASGQAYP